MPSFDFFQYTIPEWRTLPPISSDFSLIRGNRRVIETLSSCALCTLRARFPVSAYLLANMLQLSRSYTIHLDGLESISAERSRNGLGVSRLFKVSFPPILVIRPTIFVSPFSPLYISMYLHLPRVCFIFFFTTSPSGDII